MTTQNKISLTVAQLNLNNILGERKITELKGNDLRKAVLCLNVMKLVYNK